MPMAVTEQQRVSLPRQRHMRTFTRLEAGLGSGHRNFLERGPAGLARCQAGHEDVVVQSVSLVFWQIFWGPKIARIRRQQRAIGPHN